jgi:hypothetical protein
MASAAKADQYFVTILDKTTIAAVLTVRGLIHHPANIYTGPYEKIF